MWTDRSSTPTRPRVLTMLVLVGLAAPFLGGSTQPWAWGVLSVLAGLAFVGLPPRHRLPIVVYIPAILLLLLALSAFLPAGWLEALPWREAVRRDLGIALPATVTAQPWLTLESWLLLALGVSWLAYATSLLTTSRSRWKLARAYVSGVGVLTMLAVVSALLKQPPPFWQSAHGFGFFPNRNQMGDWMALAGLLLPALIYEDWSHNRLLSLWWGLILMVIGVGLVINYSRAGVLLFFGGLVVFSLAMSLVRRWLGHAIIAMTIAMILGTLFFLFGGATRDRLQQGVGSKKEAGLSRVDIQADALDMKRATPWTGIGLGNFDAVFALHRERSRSEDRVLHPESDWMWLAAEAGWAAAAAAAAGVVAIVAMGFPLERGTTRTLRLAAMVGLLAFAVHGCVDVSAHRPGTFFPACLFGLLAIHPRYYKPAEPAVRRAFRWLGVLWIALGAYALAASFGPLEWPATAGVQRAIENFDAAFKRGDVAATAPGIERALGWAPLDWQLYYRRAVARMRIQPEQARQDFLRARALEPGSSLVPKQEGALWLAIAPLYTLTAWSEALRRDQHNPAELYGELLQSANGVALVRDGFKRMALDKPEFFLVYSSGTQRVEFSELLRQLLARDPQLTTFTTAQRQLLFGYWADKQGLESLVAAVQDHPTWKPAASIHLSRDLANRGQYERAYALRRAVMAPPVFPQIENGSTLEALQARFDQRPDDFASSYLLIRQLLLAGSNAQALEKIEAIRRLKQCPAYFYFLKAETAAGLGRWTEAWSALGEFDAATGN